MPCKGVQATLVADDTLPPRQGAGCCGLPATAAPAVGPVAIPAPRGAGAGTAPARGEGACQRTTSLLAATFEHRKCCLRVLATCTSPQIRDHNVGLCPHNSGACKAFYKPKTQRFLGEGPDLDLLRCCRPDPTRFTPPGPVAVPVTVPLTLVITIIVRVVRRTPVSRWRRRRTPHDHPLLSDAGRLFLLRLPYGG